MHEILEFLTGTQSVNLATRSIAAIVLAHVAHEITTKSLLPNVRYLHFRSRSNLDIVFPGYPGVFGRYRKRADPQALENPPQTFDERTFCEVLDTLGANLGWEYSGRPTIVLLRAARPDLNTKVRLDYSEYIAIDLAGAIESHVITSVEEFFETLFRSCSNMQLEEMSDRLGGRSFLRYLLDVVPENLPIKGTARAIALVKYFQLRRGYVERESKRSKPVA